MNKHPGGEEHTRRMLELARLPAGASVLDLGAGDGETLRLLQSLGYDAEGIDLAEDRERFDALLERFGIRRPRGHSVRTLE